MPQLARAEGLVLATQPHAETDLIAILFTRDRGRLDILAKGARRLERSTGAVLDALHQVTVIYYRRRSGLHLLKEVELRGAFPRIRSDWERLSVALRALEWAVRLLAKESPEEGLYRMTLAFLQTLEDDGAPPLLGLSYQLRLLHGLGHGPTLARCANCGAGEDLFWVPQRGGALCGVCGGSGEPWPVGLGQALEALRRLPWSAVSHVRLTKEQLDTAERLLGEYRTVQVGP